MYLYSITFYIFSLVAVLSALMVISARNPVHSVLFLILSFVNASGLFVLLGAEFLAMILVVVYVGAVAVLFVSSPQINEIENTKLIGQVLYTDYFYLFQISGLILLVAMIGSITLTLRDRGQVKRQNISSQNYIDANKAIEKKKVKLGEGI